jgi:hypothetical protein
MQAGSNPVLDSSAAHPPEIRASDPRHLGNMTKKMDAINKQVASDTKYDPNPPPRVDQNGKPVTESFSNKLSFQALRASDAQINDELLYANGAGALIVLISIGIILLDPKLLRQTQGVQYGFVFLALAGIMCIITLIVVYMARKRNELIMWYPDLRNYKPQY